MLRVIDVKTRRISTVPGSESLWSPRWSPNGNYLAAISGNSQNLVLYGVRTHEQAELARGGIGYPSWSRDSGFVYFDTIGSDPAFYRVRIRDRKISEL